MSRRHLIAALVVIITLAGFAFGIFSFVQLSHGKKNIVLDEFSEGHEFEIRAPSWPFRKGVLFFEASGKLSLPVRVTLSAEGEVLEEIDLYGHVFYETFGGPEHWKEDLKVTFEPSAASGAVSLLMRCGR